MANGQYAVQNFKYKEICEVVESEDNVVYCVYSEKEDTAIAGLWGGRIQFLNPQSKIVAVDICLLYTSGIYEAMNEAALLADGEYLLFLNADDQLYDSNVIDKAVGFLSNHTQCDCLLYTSRSLYPIRSQEAPTGKFRFLPICLII